MWATNIPSNDHVLLRSWTVWKSALLCPASIVRVPSNLSLHFCLSSRAIYSRSLVLTGGLQNGQHPIIGRMMWWKGKSSIFQLLHCLIYCLCTRGIPVFSGFTKWHFQTWKIWNVIFWKTLCHNALFLDFCHDFKIRDLISLSICRITTRPPVIDVVSGQN